MQYVKMHHNFMARRRLTDEECKKLKDKGCMYNYSLYEDVIFCYKCKKMHSLKNCLKIESGEEGLYLLPKLIGECYEFQSESDILLYIAENQKVTNRYIDKSIFTSEEQEKIRNIKIMVTGKGHPVLICPECKKRISFVNLEKLQRTKDWIYKNKYIHKWDIKEEGDKIFLSVYIYSIFPNTEVGKLKYVETNVRFVFNTKTKCIYAMQPIYESNMKPVYKNIKRILNITYMMNAYYFMSDMQRDVLSDKQVLRSLADYMCEKNGKKTEELFKVEPFVFNIASTDSAKKNTEDVKESTEDQRMFLCADNLFLYFRYHYLNKNTLAILKKLCVNMRMTPATRQRRKRLLQQIYIMQDSPEEIIAEMKRKKLPQKKKLRKMVMENLFIIYIYRLLTRIGMKDYNIIINCIEELEKYHTDFLNIYLGTMPYNGQAESYKRFLKEFVKHKGDAGIKRHIFDEITRTDGNNKRPRWWLLHDSVRLYDDIIEKLDGEEFPVEFGNIAKMHDDMSKMYNKLRHRNTKIPYMQKEIKYNLNVGDYMFRLTPDTYSMIDCGVKLGICVGSYGDSAVRKLCTIVFMLKEDRFVGCIEIKGNKLRQAKSRFNNLLRGEDALALKTWVEYLGINASNTYDYRHIQEGKFDVDAKNKHNFSVTEVLDDIDEANKNIIIPTKYLILKKDNMQEETLEVIENIDMEELENQLNIEPLEQPVTV